MRALPPGDYIAIAASSTRAAVLSDHGSIIVGGEPWTGTHLPTDSGYTDIALGPDYGLALHEVADERHVTGPISPGQKLISREGSEEIIPVGSTIDHTHNGITRVFDANGTPLFWANDLEAPSVTFPEGTKFPSTIIHYVTPHSLIIANENYEASIYKVDNPEDYKKAADTSGFTLLLNITESAWYDEQNPSGAQTIPQAICIDGKCSVGATSRRQLILSDPLPANGNTLVYSVSENSPHFYRATLRTLGSTSEADTRTMLIQKSWVDLNQPLGFNIITGNGSVGGTNVFVSAQAKLTNASSQMQYTITGTATMPIPEMNIAPQVWKKTDTGDVLVFAGPPVKCSAATTCVAAGDYTPSDAATYYANATVLYTVPKTMNGMAAGTEGYVVMMASGVKASGTKIGQVARGFTNFDLLISSTIETDLKAMGYTFNNFAGSGKTGNDLLATLQASEIFIFLGHGGAGYACVWMPDSGTPCTKLYGKGTSPNIQSGNSLSNVKLAIWDDCEGAKEDATNGALVTETDAKGAKCTIGWTPEIKEQGTPVWQKSFWFFVMQHYDIKFAQEHATKAVIDDKYCKVQTVDACGFKNTIVLGDQSQVLFPYGLATQSDRDSISFGATYDISETDKLRAVNAIRTFAEDPDLAVSYELTLTSDNRTRYEFIAADGSSYTISARSGEVVAFWDGHSAQSNTTKKISEQEALATATAFAMKKMPSFFATTDNRTVNLTLDYHNAGSYIKYDVGWREELRYVEATNTSKYQSIRSPNGIDISVDANTGNVTSYFMAIEPITVSIIPSISEETARARAYEYCVQNNIPADATKFVSQGLLVAGESETPQYLLWGFIIPRVDDTLTGGIIAVDAHTGAIRSFLRNM